MPATLEAPAVGTIMPDIAFTDANGAAVTLGELTAGRRALVYFMRAATCQFCNAHVQKISGMVAAGELADVAVVIVTPGDAKDVATVTSTLPKAAVTVVATGTESRSAVGLSSFLTMQHSGTFVLSATGRVLAKRTATMPTASFSRSEALASLAG